ncbi:hypothetical protein HDU93_009523 [Gonapodya sp. JEL0774]|nr:hypothetical protein HDU93_009523 [Gonapodya sp. JEL0774]
MNIALNSTHIPSGSSEGTENPPSAGPTMASDERREPEMAQTTPHPRRASSRGRPLPQPPSSELPHHNWQSPNPSLPATPAALITEFPWTRPPIGPADGGLGHDSKISSAQENEAHSRDRDAGVRNQNPEMAQRPPRTHQFSPPSSTHPGRSSSHSRSRRRHERNTARSANNPQRSSSPQHPSESYHDDAEIWYAAQVNELQAADGVPVELPYRFVHVGRCNYANTKLVFAETMPTALLGKMDTGPFKARIEILNGLPAFTMFQVRHCFVLPVTAFSNVDNSEIFPSKKPFHLILYVIVAPLLSLAFFCLALKAVMNSAVLAGNIFVVVLVMGSSIGWCGGIGWSGWRFHRNLVSTLNVFNSADEHAGLHWQSVPNPALLARGGWIARWARWGWSPPYKIISVTSQPLPYSTLDRPQPPNYTATPDETFTPSKRRKVNVLDMLRRPGRGGFGNESMTGTADRPPSWASMETGDLLDTPTGNPIMTQGFPTDMSGWRVPIGVEYLPPPWAAASLVPAVQSEDDEQQRSSPSPIQPVSAPHGQWSRRSAIPTAPTPLERAITPISMLGRPGTSTSGSRSSPLESRPPMSAVPSESVTLQAPQIDIHIPGAEFSPLLVATTPAQLLQQQQEKRNNRRSVISVSGVFAALVGGSGTGKRGAKNRTESPSRAGFRDNRKSTASVITVSGLLPWTNDEEDASTSSKPSMGRQDRSSRRTRSDEEMVGKKISISGGTEDVGGGESLGWELKQEGLIREIALTNFDTVRLKEILDAGIPIVSNQVQYSLVDRRPELRMAELCRSRGVKLLTYGTLKKYLQMIQAWGGWSKFQNLLEVLDAVAREKRAGGAEQADLSAVAVKWALGKDFVGGVIVGVRFGISSHIASNLIPFSFSLTDTDRARIETAAGSGENLLESIGDCGDDSPAWGNYPNQDVIVSAMREHYDSGFTTSGKNQFDMADHYGPSEALYRRFLQHLSANRPREPRNPAPLGFTKWVPPPGPMGRREVEKAVRERMERMGVSALDMIQNFRSHVLYGLFLLIRWDYSDKRYMDALRHFKELKQEGLIREIALTNFDTVRLKEILDADIPIVSNQVQYSLVDRRPELRMAELCRSRGVKLLTYGTLKKYLQMIQAWGGWSKFQNLLEVLDAVAREKRAGGAEQADLSAVAVKWALEKDFVGGVVISSVLGVVLQGLISKSATGVEFLFCSNVDASDPSTGLPITDVNLLVFYNATNYTGPAIKSASYETGAVRHANFINAASTSQASLLTYLAGNPLRDVSLKSAPYFVDVSTDIEAAAAGKYSRDGDGISKAMDDKIGSLLLSTVLQLVALDKTPLTSSSASLQAQLNYIQQAAALSTNVPASALIFEKLDFGTLEFSATIQAGTDRRVASTANLPSQWLRRLVVLTELSNMILRQLGTVFPLKNLTSAVISQGFRHFPSYINTKAAANLPIASFIGRILYPWGVSFLIPIFVVTIVREKEARIEVMMKMNGLKLSSYFIIQYLQFLILAIISAIVFLLAGTAGRLDMFINTNRAILPLLFLIWSNVQVSLAFFFSSFFSKNRTALVMTFLIVLCSVVVALALDALYSGPLNTAFFLWPPFAFYRALSRINNASWRRSLRPYELSSLAFPDEVGTAMVFMVVEIPIFMLLGYYLTQVLPSEFGVRKPVWFPVTAAMSYFSSLQKGRISSRPHLSRKERGTITPEQSQAVATLHKSNSSHLVTIPEEDDDVREERHRVNEGHVDMSKTPLLIQGMRKIYGGRMGKGPKIAVNNITVAAEEGRVFGLLGPNGAGKTTLISILTGIYPPTDGEAIIAGYNILWDDLTVEEHLLFYARLKGIPASEEQAAALASMKAVALQDFATRLSKGLSGGEKRRLSIAIALVGSPACVFLDEPTTGLDPEVRRLIWNIITKARAGKTIILTTHSMEEAEVLCQRIGIMAKGTMRCLGSVLRLKQLYGAGFKLTFSAATNDMSKAGSFVESILPTGDYKRIDFFSTSATYEFTPGAGQIGQIFEVMQRDSAAYGIFDWGISQTSLEEVFLEIITLAWRRVLTLDHPSIKHSGLSDQHSSKLYYRQPSESIGSIGGINAAFNEEAIGKTNSNPLRYGTFTFTPDPDYDDADAMSFKTPWILGKVVDSLPSFLQNVYFKALEPTLVEPVVKPWRRASLWEKTKLICVGLVFMWLVSTFVVGFTPFSYGTFSTSDTTALRREIADLRRELAAAKEMKKDYSGLVTRYTALTKELDEVKSNARRDQAALEAARKTGGTIGRASTASISKLNQHDNVGDRSSESVPSTFASKNKIGLNSQPAKSSLEKSQDHYLTRTTDSSGAVVGDSSSARKSSSWWPQRDFDGAMEGDAVEQNDAPQYTIPMFAAILCIIFFSYTDMGSHAMGSLDNLVGKQ